MRKLGFIISALALVLGLAQCAKKPNVPIYGYTAQTITFSNSGNDGQKGLFHEVDKMLDYHWADGDVIYVYATTNEYKSDGTTDFGTNSMYCGVLDQINIHEDKTKATFSGTISIHDGTKALRFVHYGREVNVDADGSASVDFSSQKGTLSYISDCVVAKCDREYHGNLYENCELEVQFAVVKLQFEDFGTDDDNISVSGMDAMGLNVTATGDITMNTGISSVLEKPGTDVFYTVFMPKSSTSYNFGNTTAVKTIDDCGFDVNMYYTKKNTETGEPTGDAILIKGCPNKFTVGSGTYEKVIFSKGNLGYNPSGNRWRFASNQYDRIHTSNDDVTDEYTSTYSEWIDLFGWGTSNQNHGANEYKPYSISTNNADYNAYGSADKNLYDESGNADWGYNAISNGGDSGWRTLETTEWGYMFNTRTDASAKWGLGTVSSTPGMIMLPDNWTSCPGGLNFTGSVKEDYTTNVYNSSEWSAMESVGAVFLPATGYREGASLYKVGTDAAYWSSSHGSLEGCAYAFNFYSEFVDSQINHYRKYGFPVRLVCKSE